MNDSKKILIIDDEEHILDNLAIILKTSGINNLIKWNIIDNSFGHN